VIGLRRPPVLSRVDGPFVPDGIDLDEVDARWAAMCARNPAYFDGRVYHVLGVHRNGAGGAAIHVTDCAYRFHAVQDADFDLGVRPLGVSGIVEREGRFLLGKRSNTVGVYQGMWEFAPSGVAEVDRPLAEVLVDELREETGMEPAREPIPIALLEDRVLRTWELIYEFAVAGEPTPSPEYDEFVWAGPHELPEPLTPLAVALGPVIRSIGT
jgi:8-oxo-dGTP pyrophosphatase MutT (NUDIX family)